MSERPVATESLSAELFRRSSVVLSFDGAQVEAWCSGLFAAWDSDAEAKEFIDYCATAGGPVAALVCRGLAAVSGGAVADHALKVATPLQDLLPANGTQIGSIRFHQAWVVTGVDSVSVVFGCGVLGADHSLLFELDSDGSLVDIQAGGRPRDLLVMAPGEDVDVDDADAETLELEGLAIDEANLETAVQHVVRAWEVAAEAEQLWSPTTRANERIAARRLEAAIGRELVALRHVPPSTDAYPFRGLSEVEFREANAASLSTLRSALGKLPDPSTGADSAAFAAWTAALIGDITDLDAAETEAVRWLEWADWLGAGLGLLRAGPGSAADPEVLVTMVNRCPEVSSTIDARDREWALYAFGLVVEHLTDNGVIVDGQLSDDGYDTLGPAMVAAWSDETIGQ